MANLFEDARVAIGASRAAHGLPLTLSERRTLVIPSEERSGWRTEETDFEVNALAVERHAGYPDALADWLGRCRDLARELAGEFAVNLPLWRPLGPPALAAHLLGPNHTDWDLSAATGSALAHGILAPASWYLTQIASVADPDNALAIETAIDAVHLIATAHVTVRQAIAVDGVSLETDVVEAANCRLRALSPLERGDMIEPVHLRSIGRGALARMPRMIVPSHVLEVDTAVRLSQEVSMQPPPRLPTSLQLHQIQLAGPGVLVTRILPEWASLGVMSRSIPMRQHVTDVTDINHARFEAVCETGKLLAAYTIDAPERRSTGSLSAADAMPTLMLSSILSLPLRALLLPFDRETRFADMSYRFSGARCAFHRRRSPRTTRGVQGSKQAL